MIKVIMKSKYDTNKLCFDEKTKYYLVCHKEQPKEVNGDYGKYKVIDSFVAKSDDDAIQFYINTINAVIKKEMSEDTPYNLDIKSKAKNMIQVNKGALK